MADDKRGVRKLIVTECNPVHSGTTKTGSPYTIYDIRATREDRTKLPDGMKLRSFEAFPLNRVVEVKIEKYRSEQYGDSYTIKSLDPQAKQASSTQALNEIRQQVDEISNRLAALWRRVDALEGKRQQAAPTAPQSAAPAPTEGLPSDDDIPF